MGDFALLLLEPALQVHRRHPGASLKRRRQFGRQLEDLQGEPRGVALGHRDRAVAIDLDVNDASRQIGLAQDMNVAQMWMFQDWKPLVPPAQQRVADRLRATDLQARVARLNVISDCAGDTGGLTELDRHCVLLPVTNRCCVRR